MSKEWELKFSGWAKPPGKTESEKIERTIKAIRKALNSDGWLKDHSKVYVQGSYRNRVNVKQDSDIDIGILYTGNAFCEDYPEGMTRADFGNIEGDHSYSDFKNEVVQALINYFGNGAVTRGNKAIDIHENTYRIDADVVPVYVHRRYSKDGSYICGTQFFSDDDNKIINWPERLYDDRFWPDQHYENNVSKNSVTGRKYKGVVRILKKLRNEMADQGIVEANPISGFLIECLVWNASNHIFSSEKWEDMARGCITFLWSNTQNYEACEEWGEVSELKYLFKGSPDSKRKEAYNFIDAAWDYIGVKK